VFLDFAILFMLYYKKNVQLLFLKLLAMKRRMLTDSITLLMHQCCEFAHNLIHIQNIALNTFYPVLSL
jgi:hypothetical protein